MIETHVCLMAIEAILMITVMSLCVRRLSPPPPAPVSTSGVSAATHPTPRLSKRRSSADSCTPPLPRKVKRRAASEEALHAGRMPWEHYELLSRQQLLLCEHYEFLFEVLCGELVLRGSGLRKNSSYPSSENTHSH